MEIDTINFAKIIFIHSSFARAPSYMYIADFKTGNQLFGQKHLIPLFHTGPESHELPRIDKYLDSCLNRTQFVKILTNSHSPESVLAICRSIGNSAQQF